MDYQASPERPLTTFGQHLNQTMIQGLLGQDKSLSDNDYASRTTLNTLPPKARIYYRHHPFFNQTFKLLQRGAGKPNQVTLAISDNKTLTVPQWMIEPESSAFKIDDLTGVPTSVLLELLDFLQSNCFALGSPNRTQEKLDERIRGHVYFTI